MIGWLTSLLTGGVVEKFTAPLLDAYRAKLNAQNDGKRLEAEQAIKSIEAARDIAVAEAADRWSAVRMGRWLIVVPWSVWWASIYAVSIINPLFGTSLTIHAVPSDIANMAMVLIPAIVIGDAGALIARKFAR